MALLRFLLVGDAELAESSRYLCVRWSQSNSLAWATVLLAAAVVWVAPGCSRSTGTPSSKDPDVPPLYEEVEAEVGLNFQHDPGAPGTWFYPEIMVGGAAMFDYDGDGDLDLFLVNCGDPEIPGVVRDPERAKDRLYRQEANGQFTDVTDASGLGDTGYGAGVVVGDINNDGHPDVFITNYGKDSLFLNQRDGTFRNVADEAGVVHERWSAGACFIDYDRDGWLDLYVANYVDYFPSRACFGSSGRRDYCGPASFEKSCDRLFRNVTGQWRAAQGADADPLQVRFEDVTIAAGIAKRECSGLGVLALDFDDDGWQDIYVANDMMANTLWMNQKDGTFRDEGLSRGVAYDALGRPAANMGIAWADLNNDPFPDIYVTHMAGEMNNLYLSDGPLSFREEGVSAGVAAAMHPLTTFGTVMFDIDHDGSEDLVAVNGSMKLPDTAVNIPPFSDRDAYWQIFAEPNMIFLNSGDGTFRQHLSRRESFCTRLEVSRGICTGDVDRDGDLDMLLLNTAAPARLYRNVAAKAGNWLRVRVVEPALGGRDALGARITVHAYGQRWMRWLGSGGSYLSSHESVAHFGLGAVENIERVEVRWPDGSEEVFPGGAVNVLCELRHGTATTQAAPENVQP